MRQVSSLPRPSNGSLLLQLQEAHAKSVQVASVVTDACCCRCRRPGSRAWSTAAGTWAMCPSATTRPRSTPRRTAWSCRRCGGGSGGGGDVDWSIVDMEQASSRRRWRNSRLEELTTTHREGAGSALCHTVQHAAYASQSCWWAWNSSWAAHFAQCCSVLGWHRVYTLSAWHATGRHCARLAVSRSRRGFCGLQQNSGVPAWHGAWRRIALYMHKRVGWRPVAAV